VTWHWLQGRKAHFVQDLHEKYGGWPPTPSPEMDSTDSQRPGPVVRVSPQEVDFTDLDAFKTIYSHRETYVKTTWYRRIAGSPLLTVFNTSDVDVHRRHRRLLGGPMAESALAQHIPTISARVDLTIQRIREEAASRGCADVWQWCLFMATDVIGELTFGESFKMLEQGKVGHPTLSRVGFLLPRSLFIFLCSP
jgi:cytochrome P450